MSDGESINIAGVSVMICLPIKNGAGFPPRTTMSLVSTCVHATRMGMDLVPVMEVGGVVEMVRDALIEHFMQSGKQKLFWIDADMVWTPDDFARIVALSTKYDVVGASYPAKVEGPTQYYIQFSPDMTRNEMGLMEVHGMGLGFCIMDRKVIEPLYERAPRCVNHIDKRESRAVFRTDIFNGNRRTEDMAFFSDIRDLGFKIWADPSIMLGHIGDKEWRHSERKDSET